MNGPDISGAEQPYSPDWGNFGNDSGGECGVAATRRFPMPDVPDSGYWAGAAAALWGNGGTAPWAFNASSNPTLARRRGSGNSSPAKGQAAGSRPLVLSAGAEAAADAAPLKQQQQQQPVDAGAASPTNRHGRPNAPFWYSYSHGPVHFVVLSSEHDLSPHSHQHAWLAGDLAAVDRCATPWVVLAVHRPLYVVFPHKSNRIVAEHLRDNIEDLINDFQVDVVFSGHMHSYSRTCNVLHERCIDESEGGTTHVTIGTGGKKLSQVERNQEDWVQFATDGDFGYGLVTVDDGFSLLFEFIAAEDGRVLDSVKLRNGRASNRACDYGSAGAAATV